jgi:hypothetical protein
MFKASISETALEIAISINAGLTGPSISKYWA